MGQESLSNTAVTADLAGDEAIPCPVYDCIALTLTNRGSNLLASLLPAVSSTAKEKAKLYMYMHMHMHSTRPMNSFWTHWCLVHGTETIPS